MNDDIRQILTTIQTLGKPKLETVRIAGAEAPLYIRTMTAVSRDAYDESLNDGTRRDYKNLSARLVARCLCDAEGNLVYADPEAGAAELGQLASPVIDRLFRAARRLNWMGKDELEAAEKNLGATAGSSSSSG